MLVRVYWAVLGLVIVWFCAAAFLGWKAPDVLGAMSSGRGGGFYGGGWGGGK